MSAAQPAVFDAKMASRLEAMYASPQAIAQRRALRAAIGAGPGETGIDVGCGLAHLACELAKEIAPGGRIIAIDSSPHMVGEAAARVAAAGLDSLIDVRGGDATGLGLAPASADFIVAAQVYSYVADVGGAIVEAARVLKPGGRLAILETDWDLCAFESADRALTRRILDARALHFAHPHLPPKLHRLIRAGGLNLERCEVFPIVETRYDPASFGAALLPVLRDAAIRDGIDAAAVDGWIADICSRRTDGEYFFSTSRFIFVAVKPR